MNADDDDDPADEDEDDDDVDGIYGDMIMVICSTRLSPQPVR